MYENLFKGPDVVKLFSCSTQLRLKFILLINGKIVLTFISKTNYRLWWTILVFMSSLNFILSQVEHEKSIITSGPGFPFFVKFLLHNQHIDKILSGWAVTHWLNHFFFVSKVPINTFSVISI